MNKRIFTIIISTVCLISVSVVSIGVLVKNGTISADNLFTGLAKQNDGGGNSAKGNTSASTASASRQSSSSFKYPIFEAMFLEGAQYTLQYSDAKYKPGEYGDMLFKFDKMEITKKRGDFDCCENWHEQKDASGNLINAYSYVVASIEIINQGKRPHEIGLGNIRLILGKQEMAELRTYNSHKSNTLTKDYFILTLQPNQKYQFNLAYIIEDDIVQQYKNEIYLDAGFTSSKGREIPVIGKSMRKNNG